MLLYIFRISIMTEMVPALVTSVQMLFWCWFLKLSKRICFLLLWLAMFMAGGYSQLPFHAATQTYGEPTYPRSHHPQSEYIVAVKTKWW